MEGDLRIANALRVCSSRPTTYSRVENEQHPYWQSLRCTRTSGPPAIRSYAHAMRGVTFVIASCFTRLRTASSRDFRRAR